MASRPQRAPGRVVVVVLVALLACAGCATAPKYVAPSVEAGDAFKELGPWQPAGVDVPLAGPWWELFGDPVLSGLAGRIEAANPALAASVARYRAGDGARRACSRRARAAGRRQRQRGSDAPLRGQAAVAGDVGELPGLRLWRVAGLGAGPVRPGPQLRERRGGQPFDEVDEEDRVAHSSCGPGLRRIETGSLPPLQYHRQRPGASSRSTGRRARTTPAAA